MDPERTLLNESVTASTQILTPAEEPHPSIGITAASIAGFRYRLTPAAGTNPAFRPNIIPGYLIFANVA